MSFSQQVKQEIVAVRRGQNPCCVTAGCYGIACFGKYFDSRGVVLHTEQEYIARWACDLYTQAGIVGQVTPRGQPVHSWEFAVKDPYEVEKLLAMFAHTGEETSLRINRENLGCEGCYAAFVTAAFLCAGIVVDPEKGYTLEFVSPRYLLLKDFAALLAGHGMQARHTQRKGTNVLYFKASEQIEDLLTLMGATKSALEIMNLKVYKDFRNRANRITNCETANIDKMVAANQQVLRAVEKLERAGVLGTLSEPLQQAAALRVAYPESSLAELARQSPQPVSKSGLSHRFKALCEKADALGQHAVEREQI